MQHISWQRRTAASMLLTFMLAATFMAVAFPAVAQDEAAPPADAAPEPAEPAPAATPAPAAEEKEPGVFGQLWNYYRIGGITMHFMLLCSIASVTVIVERAWAYKKAGLDPADFITRVRDAVLKGGAKAGLAVCEEESFARKPVANVVKSALLKFDEPAEDLEKAVENSAVLEVARLEKFLPILATVANVGPIFGFLGTVTGMISSFDAIAKYGMTNPALVAKGISEALITTATGLFIALFSQPFYNYYSARVTGFLRQMEAASNVLLETHGELRRGGK